MGPAYLSLRQQILLVLYSLAAGAAIGVIYTALRSCAVFVRVIVRESGKCTVISFISDLIADVVFSVIATVVTVVFIYTANNGTVRYYMLIPAFFSLIVFSRFIGKYINRGAACFARLLRRVCRRIVTFMKKLIRPLKMRIQHGILIGRSVRIIKNR